MAVKAAATPGGRASGKKKATRKTSCKGLILVNRGEGRGRAAKEKRKPLRKKKGMLPNIQPFEKKVQGGDRACKNNCRKQRARSRRKPFI